VKRWGSSEGIVRLDDSEVLLTPRPVEELRDMRLSATAVVVVVKYQKGSSRCDQELNILSSEQSHC